MKKQLLSIVTVLSLLLAVTGIGFAQVPAAISVDIPFDFTVGNKPLPAGKYTIKRLGSADTMIIQSADNASSAPFLVHGGETVNGYAPCQVSFNRYGDEYYLSQVWDGSDNMGKKLLKSKSERETASRTREHLARNDADSKVVTLIAKFLK
jgi:hypothetical protein